MDYSPFFPSADNLPQKLPIFPLENAVLMPHAELPLNIFEPRYLNMVNDVLASHHMFGMVQPDPAADQASGQVYRAGCAGRITSYRETADGRILLTLTGVCRFNIRRELPGKNGYRLVAPDWQRFLSDLQPAAEDDFPGRHSLLRLLSGYLQARGLQADWEFLETLTTLQLVHSMTVLLPIEPAEKQAILESVEASALLHAFQSALQCSFDGRTGKSRH